MKQNDAASVRLSRQVLRFLGGKEADVVLWLQKLGCGITLADAKNGVWTLVGPTGVTCGLSRDCDPITTLAQFGFLLAGIHWPGCYPLALKLIVQEMDGAAKRRRKVSREAFSRPRPAAIAALAIDDMPVAEDEPHSTKAEKPAPFSQEKSQ